MIALIDFDEILYKAGFASQSSSYAVSVIGEEEDGPFRTYKYKKEATDFVKKHGEEDFTITPLLRVDSLDIAIYNTDHTIQTILDNLATSKYIGYFSGHHNFRVDVATLLPYKGNRDPSHKPYWYKEIKQHLIDNYNSYIVHGMEADDGMSITQWQHLTEDELTCIVSQDKDLRMVPGFHYLPNSQELLEVSYLDGCRTFYKQMLKGDSTDNIPGLFKVTGKKANKHLMRVVDESVDEMEMYEHVLTCYEGNVNIVKEIGQLLWMKRDEEEDWEPGQRYYS